MILPLRMVGLVFVLGLLRLPPASAQITEICSCNVTLRTSQVVKIERTNKTRLDEEWTRQSVTVTRFSNRNAVQRVRESTASKLFKADAKFSAKLDGFGRGSVETEFLSKIKQAYTETGAFEKTEEVVQKHEEKMKLAPGEKVTIYENTTEGGGYQHNWETTEPITEAEKKPVTVRLFVTRDYTPILNEILLSVIQDTAGISTDSEEWGAYSRICQFAKTKDQPLYGYINAILDNGSTTSKLWTTGLDQDSWASVISAARKARTVMGKTDQSNPAALRILLLGFYNVRSPSHNAWAWDHLKAISGKYLLAQ